VGAASNSRTFTGLSLPVHTSKALFPLSSHPRFVISVLILASATQPPPASLPMPLDLPANDKLLPPHVSGHIEADHHSCCHHRQLPSFLFLSSVFNLSPCWTALSKILLFLHRRPNDPTKSPHHDVSQSDAHDVWVLRRTCRSFPWRRVPQATENEGI
jgi:hypothetical protein